MKIALFVHCFFPDHFYGTETYTLDLARNLIDLGHQVSVVSAIFPGEPRAAAQVTRYVYKGIPVVCIDKNTLPHTRVKDTYYQPEIAPVLRGILQELQPDILHVTHLINHTAVLLEVAQSLEIPTVATLTDFFGFCFNNKLETSTGELCDGPDAARSNCLACYLSAAVGQPGSRMPTWLAKPVLREPIARLLPILRWLPFVRDSALGGLIEDIRQRPDILHTCFTHYRAVITPTLFLRDAYLANGLACPAHNMWFGVDLPRTAKLDRSDGSRLQIGYIGQIAAHKGVDLLIDAFVSLGNPPADLLIYGPIDQDPRYMEELRQRAGNASIRFCGTFPPERMATILDSIDLLAIPSRWYENSPLVLLNALASHTPAVVSNVAGLTEFIEEGRNGFVFERGSAVDLGRVLRKFVDAPTLAAQLATSTNFARTTRAMTEDVVGIYKSIL